MEGDNEFLKFIYNEDLYIIDEPKISDKAKEGRDDKQEYVGKAADSIVEEPAPVSFFGNNEKGILLLVNEQDNELLNQSDLDLLMKIVESGLRYSKNDFALVNTAKFEVDQILSELECRYLISFGIEDPVLNMRPLFYDIQDVNDKKMLLSEPLSILANDQSKKMKLWKALKSMFNI